QSTMNQFFDEGQFESYRMLGYHICRDVFHRASSEARRGALGSGNAAPAAGPGAPPAAGPVGAPSPAKNSITNRDLFMELRQQGSQVPTSRYQQYSDTAESWSSWETLMTEDRRLASLNLDLYPEVEAAVRADRERLAGLQAAGAPEVPEAVRDWAQDK